MALNRTQNLVFFSVQDLMVSSRTVASLGLIVSSPVWTSSDTDMFPEEFCLMKDESESECGKYQGMCVFVHREQYVLVSTQSFSNASTISEWKSKHKLPAGSYECCQS